MTEYPERRSNIWNVAAVYRERRHIVRNIMILYSGWKILNMVLCLGRSSLDFLHGFSKVPTWELTETDLRPVQGVKTYMILNATDLNAPGRITRVELIDLAGQLEVKQGQAAIICGVFCGFQ